MHFPTVREENPELVKAKNELRFILSQSESVKKRIRDILSRSYLLECYEMAIDGEFDEEDEDGGCIDRVKEYFLEHASYENFLIERCIKHEKNSIYSTGITTSWLRRKHSIVQYELEDHKWLVLDGRTTLSDNIKLNNLLGCPTAERVKEVFSKIDKKEYNEEFIELLTAYIYVEAFGSGTIDNMDNEYFVSDVKVIQ